MAEPTHNLFERERFVAMISISIDFSLNPRTQRRAPVLALLLAAVDDRKQINLR
jgi:hypothetical protein